MIINKIPDNNYPAVEKILRDTEQVLNGITGVHIRLHMTLKTEYLSESEAEWLLLQNAVCTVTGLTWKDIISRCRKAHLVLARQLVVWFARQRIGFITLRELGQNLGGLDHSSIINHYRKFESLLSVGDMKVVNHYNKVKTILDSKLEIPTVKF